MSFSEIASGAQQDRQRRQSEQDERVRASIEAYGALTGQAYGTDRAVSVEVATGGLLQNVELSDEAVRRGAAALRANILAASKKATARANYRAAQAFSRAMGNEGTRAAEQLGLSYDPRLLEDEACDEGQLWR